MKQKNKIIVLTLFLVIFLFGCKNYKNEMFNWASSVPVGTDFEVVKTDKPDFLEIDWRNPDTLENGMTRYFITEINGNNDILKMEYFLEFENNKFRGLFGHK